MLGNKSGFNGDRKRAVFLLLFPLLVIPCAALLHNFIDYILKDCKRNSLSKPPMGAKVAIAYVLAMTLTATV